MSRESAMNLAKTQVPAQATTPAAPAVTTPVETPAQAAPAEAATIPSSLAKKEAEIVRKQQELKKQEEAFLAQKKQADELISRGQKFEELKKSDIIEAMRYAGFTDTDIFNFFAQAQKPVEPTPEEKAAELAKKSAQEVIDEFKKTQAEQNQQLEAQKTEQVLKGFKDGIGKSISANAEKYEYCAFEGPAAEALVYELILQSVEDSKGKSYIPVEEAIELVENYYEERDKGMAALKKRQPAQAPAEQPKGPVRTRTVDPSSPGLATAKERIQRTRTLSNSATATVASTAAPKRETPSEKRARLEAWLKTGQNPAKS